MGQKRSRWSVYWVLLPIALGMGVWQGWAWWSWASAPLLVEQPSGGTARPQKVTRLQVPEGTPTQHIGQDLAAAGLIRSTLAWNLWARWLLLKYPQGGFKAGTYELSPTQSLQSIAAKIWTGDVVRSSFTIPEGWSLRQMAAYFEAQGFFKAQEFLAAASKVPQDRYPWLPANLPHLEGFLYPDTYELVGERIAPQMVIDQMLDRFEQVALPTYRQYQGQASLNLLQWVTLASIVEKEAVIPSERPRIAGVLVQRLQKGMPLGADPTVEYGLNIRQTPENPLTLTQVNTPSPYNTYLNPGLPPTPIASPGLASLEAALYPEKTPYLYFVARYDGTHVFSRTLAEHEAAQVTIRDEVNRRQQEKSSKPMSSQ